MKTPQDRLKYDATRMDIVNDFYDEVQRLFEKYRYQREAVCALDEVESLVVWWTNAPAVVAPGHLPPLPPSKPRGSLIYTIQKGG